MKDVRIAEKLINLKQNATARNLYFDLSFKKLKSLMTRKTCYYTGLPFEEGNQDFHRSIDRVDNKKGYVDNNVVACLVRINALKSNMTTEELILILKGVSKHIGKNKVKV